MKVIRAINTLVSAAREVFPDHGTAGPCKVAKMQERDLNSVCARVSSYKYFKSRHNFEDPSFP